MKISHCDRKSTIGGGDRNNIKPCFIQYEQYNYLLCIYCTTVHELLFRNFKPAMMSGILNIVESNRIPQCLRFFWSITSSTVHKP